MRWPGEDRKMWKTQDKGSCVAFCPTSWSKRAQVSGVWRMRWESGCECWAGSSGVPADFEGSVE